MGAGGASSGGTYVYHNLKKLKPTGKPNSRSDLYVNGKLKQSRWYDYEGKAVRNRDYFHQNSGNLYTFPHDHNWGLVNGQWTRIKSHIEPDYVRFPEDVR